MYFVRITNRYFCYNHCLQSVYWSKFTGSINGETFIHYRETGTDPGPAGWIQRKRLPASQLLTREDFNYQCSSCSCCQIWLVEIFIESDISPAGTDFGLAEIKLLTILQMGDSWFINPQIVHTSWNDVCCKVQTDRYIDEILLCPCWWTVKRIL